MKVKNWSQFQHFKDRKPPWIKLYRDILDDADFHALSDSAARCILMLWLLASEAKEYDGSLPSTKQIAFRLRMSEAKLKPLLVELSHYLRQDDIGAISGCHQSDAPETETETETERETETETDGAREKKPTARFSPPSLEDVQA